MTRSHTLINLRNAERRLAQTMSEIESLQATEDYELDLQFFSKLVHLMQCYDFSPDQVTDILITREMSLQSYSPGHSGAYDLFYLRKLVGMDPLSEPDARLAPVSPVSGEACSQPGTTVAGSESTVETV